MDNDDQIFLHIDYKYRSVLNVEYELSHNRDIVILDQ
jgi:hypothetical protein